MSTLRTTSTTTGSGLLLPHCPTGPETQAYFPSSRYSFSSRGAGGARTMMAAGGRSGSSGGGGREGDSPEPSGVHPGQGENGEADAGADHAEESEGGKPNKPSSYTFRRRNAIVEGVEDAPRVDDFPDASS
ncbi:hypothetical protein BGX23_001818 [Mortierella sp. AD031]|nr:hypothetical protein BGX23_001818 [Mortierella sp. AD031]